MARQVRISENALLWIEAEAERLASLDRSAADRFKRKINDAIAALSDFSKMGPPGKIRGTRTLAVDRRYILTMREHDSGIEIAAVRSHWQQDSHAPREVLRDPADDEQGTSTSAPEKK